MPSESPQSTLAITHIPANVEGDKVTYEDTPSHIEGEHVDIKKVDTQEQPIEPNTIMITQK